MKLLILFIMCLTQFGCSGFSYMNMSKTEASQVIREMESDKQNYIPINGEKLAYVCASDYLDWVRKRWVQEVGLDNVESEAWVYFNPRIAITCVWRVRTWRLPDLCRLKE